MKQDRTAQETIEFLVDSVKKISDIIVTSDGKNGLRFEQADTKVNAIYERLERLERDLRDQVASMIATTSKHHADVTPQSQLVPGSESYKVPVLNLGKDSIVEIYCSTPALLEPFSQPCSISSRTLSGVIDTVELDYFDQGSTWVLEGLDGWMLVPRPGSLDRKASLTSLERLYEIEGVRQLPVQLHLQQPAQLDSVVIGRRWQLRYKGRLSARPDPLRVSLSERMSALEARLARLEEEM